MHGAEHLISLFILLGAAQVGGWLFRVLGQPSVIGQMLAGVVVGPAVFGIVHEGEVLEFIAELGAIFLLFLVGLEMRVGELLSVGREAVLVALLGVTVPFGAGFGFSLLAGYDQMAAAFMSAAFIATSVGITAAVLQEFNVLSRRYTRVILGAAVIDDILSLIVLAVVSGMARGGSLELGTVVELTMLSLVFVAGALTLVPAVRRLRIEVLPFKSPFGFTLVLGLGLAALAGSIGLAPIIGAFIAGVLLAEVQEHYELMPAVHSVEAFVAPVFFAMVGVKLDLGALAEPTTLLVGALASLLAIGSKAVAGLGALRYGVREACIVGAGMIPRGEVVLIVVAVGLSSGVLNDAQYAVALMMVVVTTLLAPMLLRPIVAWAEAHAGDRLPPPAERSQGPH